MLQGWVVVAVALGYIGSLFIVASYGDRLRLLGRERRNRLLIYPLSLAIYCTSWTFFGSVGLAARTGYDFLTIYIGPALMVGLATPLLVRIVRLAKAQNITSIADFIAARYGKNQGVAATVTLIAIVGTVPYVALQLKAVSSSLATILGPLTTNPVAAPVLGDLALLVALSMATFAVLFGTRHIDATEHQHGLILAIATESMVKLVAFVAVGVFVTFVMFDGPWDLVAQAQDKPAAAAVLAGNTQFGTFAVMTLLSLCAITLLPRQFHVTVVENNNEQEIRRAAWLFPLYLVLINLFVVPIAVAGLIRFPAGSADSDMFVLALPLSSGNGTLALVAFIGGLSAATAMVIVESVALAIMVSNDLFVPLVLQRRADLITSRGDVGTLLLKVRRVAIFAILLLAYVYYRLAGEAQLASIGLLSFAAVAQLAPAFFGGLVWRRGTARGALAGMILGILVWAYTLLLPSFADAGLFPHSFLSEGPAGLALLRPQALFGLDLPPLVHGVVWSLAVNIIAYVGSSLAREPTSIEQVQADLFVPAKLAPIAPSFRLWRSSVTVEDLTTTVARYLGEERTRTSFESFAAQRRLDLDPKANADFEMLRYAEHLLASAIGAASSRLVLSLLLRQKTVSTKAALKLLDDASAAIHYNREILQTALDHVRQGIAVFDKEMHLLCWNRQFGEVLDLPPGLVRIGTGLDDILRYKAAGGSFGPGEPDDLLHQRLARWTDTSEPLLERFPDRGLVVEVRASRMPDGGVVTTLTDITPSVEAAEALERANETLERRVRERTRELERLNTELGRAKAAAEEANISKTRFLAAASHDILQPLNAARLYVTSLVERKRSGEEARLVDNVDASLEAVEEILGALLDISRLDTGAMTSEIVAIRIDELTRQLELEFSPLAKEKGLELTFVHSSLTVQSDRRLLRRLLQNLVSNAVKYTPSGRVVVGCRRRGEAVRIDVYDTGIGIPKSKQKVIFTEFHRLEQGAKVARGLGLGLSIVERIARMLGHRIDIRSEPGRGSHFGVVVPLARTSAKEVRRPEPRRIDRRQLTGLTVLCIDNEPKILDGMQTLLGGWGCEVITATDVETALAAIDQAMVKGPVSGLLVDYHLDQGHGLDVTSLLRERLGNFELPAILITADRSTGVLDAARAHDVQVLHKPVKPAALRALLGQWRLRNVAAAE
ncbi:PAS domain-containing hybrid sensor histidine kinase/response regulator [Xanthobacteraceae bacterium Astr-EGSB]|uniref:PAS domain-containing hybrid sensor histidine kinase/response regulator n=1 Tax=Astrobacterium formosum TaxID=3069710 RepID=UPI0027B4C811|nr:PAS domain-containing hybrid sensor histidine kinase/response regulator [Xanthobacteraceae bacterium Astr-EGSB]